MSSLRRFLEEPSNAASFREGGHMPRCASSRSVRSGGAVARPEQKGDMERAVL